MAKIISCEGEIPKRIGAFVIYKLHDDLVIRGISGFTTKALKHSPSYERCRRNASEFGPVSSLCKKVRVALQEILPKKNNLTVVNSFTKKMREVMTCDLVSLYGERQLANALMTNAGKQLLDDYDFNPDTSILISYELHGNNLLLTTNKLVLPDGANCIGFRTHQLEFDFTNSEHQLQNGDWYFYSQSSLPDFVDLAVPDIENREGVVFTILETDFYNYEKGSYLPVHEELKSVRIVTIC